MRGIKDCAISFLSGEFSPKQGTGANAGLVPATGYPTCHHRMGEEHILIMESTSLNLPNRVESPLEGKKS